jgi:hypothetical protein
LARLWLLENEPVSGCIEAGWMRVLRLAHRKEAYR